TGRAPADRQTPPAAGGPPPRGSRALAASSASGGTRAAAAEARPDLPATEAATAVASGSVRDRLKAELEQRKKKLLIVALDAATRVDLDGDELLIEFSPGNKHSRDTLAKPENAKLLREACSVICSRDVGIRLA